MSIKAEDNITLESKKPIYDIAANTDQYFWHTETGTDTGAHITEIPKEDFLEDPENGGGNLLARSNGIAVRDGLEELARFGSAGMQVGKDDGQHVLIDSQSFRIYDSDLNETVSVVTASQTSRYPHTIWTSVSGTSGTYPTTTMSEFLTGALEDGRVYVGVSASDKPSDYSQYFENLTSAWSSAITISNVSIVARLVDNTIQIRYTNTSTAKRYVGAQYAVLNRPSVMRVGDAVLKTQYHEVATIDSTGTCTQCLACTYGKIAMLYMQVYRANVIDGGLIYMGTILDCVPHYPARLVGAYQSTRVVSGQLTSGGDVIITNTTGKTINPSASEPIYLTATYIID